MLTKHRPKTHCNVVHERNVSCSIGTHTFPYLATQSKRDILCRTYKNCAKKKRVGRYLETNVTHVNYFGNSNVVSETQTKMFDSQVFDENVSALNEQESNESSP